MMPKKYRVEPEKIREQDIVDKQRFRFLRYAANHDYMNEITSISEAESMIFMAKTYLNSFQELRNILSDEAKK